MLEALDKQRVETALVVHDPTPHPTRASGGLKERFSRSAYRTQWERAFGLASKYILLSKNLSGKVRQGASRARAACERDAALPSPAGWRHQQSPG